MPKLLFGLLILVGAIGVAGGGIGVVLGPVTGAAPQQISPSTSSEYRFLSGVWFSLGCVLWWSLRQPVARRAVTRIVVICGIAGGVGRLVSLLIDGWPGPFIVALVVELVVLPALLWWHSRRWALPPRDPRTHAGDI